MTAGLPLLRPGSVVGILGGTGPQGLGLAKRLAYSGTSVIIGSRGADKAHAAAAQVVGRVSGAANRDCAQLADVVIVAVPYEGHGDLLSELTQELEGKVVIDCVSPLAFDAMGPFVLDLDAGSACEEAQQILPDSRVTGAFHHLSAVHLNGLDASIDCDVLVVGDDRGATDVTQELAERIVGVRAIYAGRLRNARQVEALTANLIAINRRYKVHAGVRVTDVWRSHRGDSNTSVSHASLAMPAL